MTEDRNNASTCICCGAPLPEGLLVCPACEGKAPPQKKKKEDIFSRLRSLLRRAGDKK